MKQYNIHVQGGPKSKPQTFVCIFAKYWPIFIIFRRHIQMENV